VETMEQHGGNDVHEGFLARAGIGFDDMLDLLNTTAGNGVGIRAVSTSGDGSDVSTMVLQKLDGETFVDLEEADFTRLPRFSRLWRGLGLTMLDVDKTLAALGVTDAAAVDDAVIESLASIWRIRGMVRVELLPLVSFWGDVDTKKDRTTKDDPVESL